MDVATADAEAKALAARLERDYPDSNRGQGASVVPLSEAIVGRIRPVLLVLLGGAGLLLLIAAVNVTSLLLVRAESRRAEISVRHALGAARGRLVRQFLTEGLLLVAASGALGLAFAAGTVPLLLRLVPAGMKDGMPFLQGLGLNGHVLAFVGSVSALGALLFTLAPYLRLPRQSVRAGLTADASHVRGHRVAALRLAARGGGAGRRGGPALRRPAARPEPRASSRGRPRLRARKPSPRSPSPCPRPAPTLPRRPSRSRARSSGESRPSPACESAAVTSLLPVSFNGNTDWIRFVGRPYDGEHNEVNQRDVGADYFRTLRAKLLRGRTFADAEDATKPRVVVINQALARRYFAEEDPVGKQIGDTGLSPGFHQGDRRRRRRHPGRPARRGGLARRLLPVQPERRQLVLARRALGADRFVASSSPSRPSCGASTPASATLDPVLMSDRIDGSPSAYLHRSSASLIGGFAGVALLLGAVGLYGVVAYSVGRRAKEIGLRMALGARPSAVYRLVLGETARLVAVGVASGLVGALAAGAALRPLLFATPAVDPWVLSRPPRSSPRPHSWPATCPRAAPRRSTR